MKTTKLSIAVSLVFAGLLTACGGSDDHSGGNSSSGSVSEKYQGIWLAPAYGTGLKVSINKAEQFNYTANSCLLAGTSDELEDADIESAYRLSHGALALFSEVGTATFGAPAQRFYPSLTLPDACVEGYTPQLGDVDYQVNSVQDFEVFSEIMADYSVSPEAQSVDWNSIEQIARAEVYADMGELELLELFYQMIEPLKDIHTSIQTPDAFARVENKPTTVYLYFQEFLDQQGLSLPLTAAQTAMANAYIETQIARYESNILDYADSLENVQQAANGMVRWFQVGHLGYLNIAAMTGFAELGNNAANLSVLDEALDEALSDLQDTQGLVLDVRTNGGGQDFLSLAIASRFVTSETVVYRKQAGILGARDQILDATIAPRGAAQYLNPVALLVSASTVSAAEAFTLAMSELDQVTLVGEATQGAFSDILEKQLPNGFQIQLSNERYLTVDGEWLEGEGVPVEIEVPVFTLEERDGEFDYAIEAAAALLQ